MLNINANPDTFAYQIAIKNKQLGFFILDTNFNLFDLIFETIKELKNKSLKNYYFDWDLELSFIFDMNALFYPDCFLISNIPFILENNSLVKKTLNQLGLFIERDDFGFSYLRQGRKKDTFILSKYLPEANRLQVKQLWDFWRYFNYYAKKNVKENIESFLSNDVDECFPYLLVKENPSIFNQITKRDLKKLTDFSFNYFEHDLSFVSFKNWEEINRLSELEKEYGIKIFALLNSLKRFPTNQELKDWEARIDIDFNKDLKVPIIPNKKITVEFGWEINELVSKKDLTEEAHYQHNCLEGYVCHLSQINHRFFSCRKRTERFTMFFIDSKLMECKGKFNKWVTTYPQDIREELDYCILTIKELLNGRN